MREIGLPWKNITFPNKSKDRETFKIKTNFDYFKFCGRKYEFLADSLEYLKMVNDQRSPVNYTVLKKIFNTSFNEINGENEKNIIFEFIDEIKTALFACFNENLKLRILFERYPIDYIELSKDFNLTY